MDLIPPKIIWDVLGLCRLGLRCVIVLFVEILFAGKQVDYPFEKADNFGNARPEKNKIDYARRFLPEVEFVHTEKS